MILQSGHLSRLKVTLTILDPEASDVRYPSAKLKALSNRECRTRNAIKGSCYIIEISKYRLKSRYEWRGRSQRMRLGSKPGMSVPKLLKVKKTQS